MKLLTHFETSILAGVFKMAEGELHYHVSLPFLLSGKPPKDIGNLEKFAYEPIDTLPTTLRSKFDAETCRVIIQKISTVSIYSHELMEAITFEQYFLGRLKQIFKAKEYLSYNPVYAVFDFLTEDQVEDRAKLQAVISLMLPFYRDRKRLEFIFDHLTTNYYNLALPLSTVDSLRKYLSRKEREGFPGCLIHGLFAQPSNNRELSPLMKDLLIVLAVSAPFHQSAEIIKENLDHVLVTCPSAKEAGFYSVSTSKITAFMATPEAVSAVSFAKDEPNEFRRKFTGVLRFSRASSPLVKIYIDGYVFQIKCRNEETGDPDTLTGIFISDDHSDFIISMAIGDTENTDLLMEAFKDYLIKTKYALPREIVVDKHIYKMLKRNVNLIALLNRFGVHIVPSSNPNRKRIERFFLLFQQRFMAHVIQYIGPGIKATKTKNAHPFRRFLIMLNENLPSRYDLIPMLKRLVKQNYNREYKSDTIMGSAHERFHDRVQNPIIVLTNGPQLLPSLFFEKHLLTVRGASVLVRRTFKNGSDDFHFYYKREMDFIERYTDEQVEGYLDSNDPSSIHLYEKGTTKFICTVPEFTVIPVAEFDRTEQNIECVRTFNRVTRELIKAHKERLDSRHDNVTKALGGRDVRQLTKAAQIKKEESSDEMLRREMELKKPKPETNMFYANKTRLKGRSKRALEEYGIEITSTI
ncbi:MAG: hypothetical protein JNL17_00380 [Cyclobacteriaceae bacterium]|nr:hypothetical protein [Cyclobacteriaceae bacterium]